MRPRSILALAGIGLSVLASIPLLCAWGAVTFGGGFGFLLVLLALLTSPLLLLWFLGPRLVWFAIRGIPVPGGMIWQWPRKQRVEDDPLEAEFEKR